jgi:general secretion pathway protein G
MTLVELMIACAILATLSAIALPLYAQVTERTRVASATADVRIIDSEIVAYQAVYGSPPATLADIGRATFKDPWGNPKDPWGNPYQYLNFAAAGASSSGLRRKDRFLVPLNSTYDLYSKGKDGQSQPALTATASRDDIVRAADGGYVGLASAF